MNLSEFDYELPPELIAQEPMKDRDHSRMLILDPEQPTENCPVLPFFRIADFLNPGDAIVFNDTKVIPARLFARKETGAKIEILLLSMLTPGRWQAFLRNAKRLTPGTKIRIRQGEQDSPYSVTFEEKLPDGSGIVAFDPAEMDDILKTCGHLPLPPYIRRPDTAQDSERYQTVYAQNPGAVAAPTAGLHFTEEVLNSLRRKGIETARLTLHVGAGTFKPVEEERIEDHKMHLETYIFPKETADLLNEVRRRGNKILAVGTTSLRTLESCVDENGFFTPSTGDTGIYIYPPYRIKSADMLLTNFHLPKSTLLMLVSAFAGMEPVRMAYKCAVRERMRFFSYGDCMLIKSRV